MKNSTTISVLRDKAAAVASYLKNLHPNAEWSTAEWSSEDRGSLSDKWGWFADSDGQSLKCGNDLVTFHCSHRPADVIRALLWDLDFAAASLAKNAS